jgi:hypothetical protein
MASGSVYRVSGSVGEAASTLADLSQTSRFGAGVAYQNVS